MAYSKLTWTTGTAITPDRLNEREAILNRMNKILPDDGDINGAGFHNSIYRGKKLGTSVTSAQWAAIKAGTFDGMFVGDYWVINNITWRIADFDYYYNTGDTACTTHHIVIVPDGQLYKAQMNETDVTTGAYVGSKMYTTNLANAKTAFANAFGSAHILTHRNHLQNAVTNGYPSGGSWYDSTIELMSEQNIYGAKQFASTANGSTIPNNYMIDNSQFSLFRLNHFMIAPARQWYWLRDTVNAACFAGVGNDGNANYNNASSTYGVRPAGSIIG